MTNKLPIPEPNDFSDPGQAVAYGQTNILDKDAVESPSLEEVLDNIPDNQRDALRAAHEESVKKQRFGMLIAFKQATPVEKADELANNIWAQQ